MGIILLVVGVLRENWWRHHALFVVQVSVILVCDPVSTWLMYLILPLLCYSYFWEGVELFQFLEKDINMLQKLVRTSEPLFMEV